MAKASLKLPDGTTVLIEGSPEEIEKIISPHRIHTGKDNKIVFTVGKPTGKSKQEVKKHEQVDIPELVNAIKESEEAELIESNILDRSSQVDRILLPLYIMSKQFTGSIGLNSTEIMKVLSELGINIFQANIAKTLSSTASKYVMGDRVRSRGPGGVKYRLSRRGVKYMNSVIHEKDR